MGDVEATPPSYDFVSLKELFAKRPSELDDPDAVIEAIQAAVNESMRLHNGSDRGKNPAGRG